MELAKLTSGEFILKCPLRTPYIQLKRYEPSYGEEVSKTANNTKMEYTYMDWELSECQDNIKEFLQSVRDCCQYGIYAKEDIENYQTFIEKQNEFGTIDSNKKYYDNRIIDGMDGDFVSSELKFYDSNDYRIPQKGKKLPFWIEVHSSETSCISLHICFHTDNVKLSGDIHFKLDTKIKYAILEACRVFAALRSNFAFDSKIYIQNTFRICLDLFRITKAFGLIFDKYKFCDIAGQDNTYLLCPIDNKRVSIWHIKQYGDIINNEHVEHRSVFELYKLKFEKCDFEDELIMQNLHNVRVAFEYCTFKKKVQFTNVTFEEVLFQKLTFKDNVDFMGSRLGEENSKIDFSGTFEQSACFQGVVFHGQTNFNKAIFNGEADFKNSEFKGLAYFSTTFSKQVLFSRAIFNKTADFQKAKFLSDADFSNATLSVEKSDCVTTFKKSAFFQEAIFNGNTNFSNVHFYGKVDFSVSRFQKEAIFISAFFDKTAIFYKTTFKDKLRFVDSSFNKQVYFIESTFNDYACFDETLFGDMSDFSQSKFDKTAYFAGTKFQGFPIFLKTTFNTSVNFTNAELDFYFNNIKDTIIKICNGREENYEQPMRDEPKIEPHKYKTANELRETFRAIKSALIKDNNLLDASQFHRVELYCKELELKYRIEEKAKNSGIRDIVDRIQLMFYRLTSDHHTDLLLILNNVIFLIAWFGFMNGALNFLFNQDYFDLSIEKIIKALGAFIACFIFVIIMLCFIFGYFKIFFVAYARKRFYCKVRKLWNQFNLKCLYNKYKNKNGIFCIAYIITAIILVVNPALLVPIFGQMIDTKSSIGFAFASLNIIYAISMFLLVFSLQKTARKNTIVPN